MSNSYVSNTIDLCIHFYKTILTAILTIITTIITWVAGSYFTGYPLFRTIQYKHTQKFLVFVMCNICTLLGFSVQRLSVSSIKGAGPDPVRSECSSDGGGSRGSPRSPRVAACVLGQQRQVAHHTGPLTDASPGWSALWGERQPPEARRRTGGTSELHPASPRVRAIRLNTVRATPSTKPGTRW